MTNKEKIVDIKYLIMEHYSDSEPLDDSQKASRACFFKYCDDIKKDLECLEKLAKNYNDLIWNYNSLECKNKRLVQALNKIEDILTDKYNHEKYPFPDDVIDAISEVVEVTEVF